MDPTVAVGPTQDQTCNVQPCIPCDDTSVPVVYGSQNTVLTTISMETTESAAYFIFNGSTSITSLSIYASTTYPSNPDSINFNYNLNFMAPASTFTVKIPLNQEYDNTCNVSLYFVVKAQTENGAVGYGQGLYSMGSYGSVIECVNYCVANVSTLSDIVSGIQYGNDGLVQPISAGNNNVGPNSKNMNPFDTLKILYIVLPIVVFILAVAISAIVLRKKFSQMRSAESSEEDGRQGDEDDADNAEEQGGGQEDQKKESESTV